MLNKGEYAFLKASSIQKEICDRSGLTHAEVTEWENKKIAATKERMQSLGMEMPEAVIETGMKITNAYFVNDVCLAITCVRSLPRRGFNKSETYKVGFSVMSSLCLEEDGQIWHHCSVTRGDRKMPTYDDMEWVRRVFMGGRKAIQIGVTSDEHISDHSLCLHWFSPMEKDPLPDFRKLQSI